MTGRPGETIFSGVWLIALLLLPALPPCSQPVPPYYLAAVVIDESPRFTWVPCRGDYVRDCDESARFPWVPRTEWFKPVAAAPWPCDMAR